MTDIELIDSVRPLVIEDGNWSSGLWTQEEVLGYLRERQNRFVKESLALTAIATIPTTPNVATVNLPVDYITTVAVFFHDLDRGDWVPLEATDAWEFDHLQGSQTPATRPVGYQESDIPESLTMRLVPTPQGNGEIELFYVSLCEDIDGTGQLLDLPPDFAAVYLKFGVLSDMLSKEGRGQDLIRARYAAMRWEEGVTLARALLEGWQ
jgi:hypothetical protein